MIVLWLTLLAIADAFITRWGLAGGWAVEVNPFMAYLFSRSPDFAVAYCIGITVIGGAVLYAARRRYPWTLTALRGLLWLRVAIMGFHLLWVVQAFVLAR